MTKKEFGCGWMAHQSSLGESFMIRKVLIVQLHYLTQQLLNVKVYILPPKTATYVPFTLQHP